MLIFLDSSSLSEVEKWWDRVDGFTSNPSMVLASVPKSYRDYARDMLSATAGKSTSLEVVADDLDTMRAQAHELAELAPNVVVKIPVTTTDGQPLGAFAQRLEEEGIKTNVTAIFYPAQAVPRVHINSVFCGRLSYSGMDPNLVIREVKPRTDALVLWAGVRGPYNIYEAMRADCDIVTAPADSLGRYFDSIGKTPQEFSLQTVREFNRDGSRIKW